jgi:dTDP-glucose 4,6-dehydratase
MATFLITGGSGFIGSALCRRLAADSGNRVINVDALTYAGSLTSLAMIGGQGNYRFVRANIADMSTVLSILRSEAVDYVVHLAAETHVDRSIDDAARFVETNVFGTLRLLQACLVYWRELDDARRSRFRMLAVSTDEVFGDLAPDAPPFTEDTPYAPRSPYAASKAGADHLVRAWHATYGLPTLISYSSNNYGAYQFPEKLIPLTILNGIERKPMRVYGSGDNVRDWLHVDDHARALELIVTRGHPGSSYAVGAASERSNLSVVTAIANLLDTMRPLSGGGSYRDLIALVPDRPGHDRRYAINPARVASELGWRSSIEFETGLEQTVRWYLANEVWWGPLRRERYAGERLGVA